MKFLTYPILSLLCSTIIQADQKPNLLFVIVDDFGAMDLGYAGSKVYETPHIDTLVKDGMLFKNAYAAHPRCVPSRYALLSGRIPARDGVPGFQNRKISKHTLPLSRVTWGEILKEAGYSTGYIGKWHLGKAGAEPDKQGFTDSRIANQAGAPPSYFYPYHQARKPGSKEQFLKIKGKENEYLTDRINDEALDFIEKNKSKPFALVLAHYAVHTPLEAPADTTQKYAKKIKSLDLEVAKGRTDKDIKTVGNGSYKTIQNNPVYAAMIDHTDRGLGKIRAKLKELGIADNTIIILTSDHGGLSTRSKDNNRPLATSNAPYRNGKGWLYDGGIRVPMIVVWPGKIKAGSISHTQTLGTDHFPTILAMLGTQLPQEVKIDGHSYLPSLLGKDSQRQPLFFHSPLGRPTSTGDHPASAIIDGDWKLIELHPTTEIHRSRYELYNLKTDPGELTNLASKETETYSRMLKLLKETKIQLGTKQR